MDPKETSKDQRLTSNADSSLSGDLPAESRVEFLAEQGGREPSSPRESDGLAKKEDGRSYIISPHRRYISKAPSALELQDMQGEIEEIYRGYKLDFFPQIFVMVTPEQLFAAGARSGIPVRYSHWSFGMAYDQLATPQEYGQGKISELVINTNPCYAYMLDSNQRFEQRLVMAHVYGHNNFFVRNMYFSDTDRKIHSTMAWHRARINEISEKVGFAAVEKFIDVVHSLDDLIDHSVLGRRKSHEERMRELNNAPDESPPRAPRFKSPASFMDEVINPPSVLSKHDEKIRRQHEFQQSRFPRIPTADILQFVIEHGQLKDWQREIMRMLREEAYYFSPQAQTKIMNEGWASYWHYQLMTKDLNPRYPSEITDTSKFHDAVLRPYRSGINPYRLGFKLFQNIEERWDRGQFGPEYEQCSDRRKKENWDLKLGLGQEKIREVRDVYNDYTFIDTFLTPEFCAQEGFFATEKNRRGDSVISSRDFEDIKARILATLPAHHRPILRVIDGNFENRGQLLIEHEYEGRNLDISKAKATMMNLFRVWGRPVYVRTWIDDDPKMLSYDGKVHRCVDD